MRLRAVSLTSALTKPFLFRVQPGLWIGHRCRQCESLDGLAQLRASPLVIRLRSLRLFPESLQPFQERLKFIVEDRFQVTAETTRERRRHAAGAHRKTQMAAIDEGGHHTRSEEHTSE